MEGADRSLKCTKDMKVHLDKRMMLTTDRVGVMHDEQTRCWEKMQRETSNHCIINQETLCSKSLNIEHLMSRPTLG